MKTEKTIENTSAMWACLKCFEFVEGTRDVVTAKSSAHNCGSTQASPKQNFLKELKKFINAISGLGTCTTTTALPPPPPPPPLHYDLIVKPKLSWDQLKQLNSKKYAVVQCSTEPGPVTKHTSKYASFMSVDTKGFISANGKLNDELKQVLMYAYILHFFHSQQ